MKSILPLALCPLLITACQPDLTGDTYTRAEAGQTQTVRTGVVESVRFVKLQGKSTTAGTLLGGVAGGFLGSEIGGGAGRKLATVAGAGLGAAAGSAAQQGIGQRQGVELSIRMSDGETVAITQEHTERETFQSGDRVKVIYGSGRTRVTRY